MKYLLTLILALFVSFAAISKPEPRKSCKSKQKAYKKEMRSRMHHKVIPYYVRKK